MGKSTIRLLVFVSVLLSQSILGVQTVEPAYTPSGGGFPLCSGIAINSPSNSTYDSNLPVLSVSVRGMLSPQIYTYALTYSLDGENNVTISVTSTFVPVEATATYANGTTATVASSFASYYLILGIVALPELSRGSHILTVYGRYDRFNDVNTNWPKFLLDKSTVQFTTNKEKTSSFPMIENGKTANETTTAEGDNSGTANDTVADLDNSGTNVNVFQPMTSKTEITYVFAALLIIGIILAAVTIVHRRRSRIYKNTFGSSINDKNVNCNS